MYTTLWHVTEYICIVLGTNEFVSLFSPTASTDSPGLCAFILTFISYLLIVATFPFSLCMCIKVRVSALCRGETVVVTEGLLEGAGGGSGPFSTLAHSFTPFHTHPHSYCTPTNQPTDQSAVLHTLVCVLAHRSLCRWCFTSPSEHWMSSCQYYRFICHCGISRC